MGAGRKIIRSARERAERENSVLAQVVGQRAGEGAVGNVQLHRLSGCCLGRSPTTHRAEHKHVHADRLRNSASDARVVGQIQAVRDAVIDGPYIRDGAACDPCGVSGLGENGSLHAGTHSAN